MAATIKIKNSSTAGSAPSAGSLVQGELAVNVTDKKIYTKDSGGSVVELGINPTTVNGLTVGKGAGSVSTNTAVGASALAANTSGANNTIVGNSAATSITSGVENSVLGSLALYTATTASYNVAIGLRSAYSLSSGTENVAIGYYALNASTTGSTNSAVGASALRFNTTGGSNAAFGYQALISNTTASNNTAVGYQAGYSQSGSSCVENVHIGSQAAYTATTGNRNTIVGVQAGYFGTTGTYNAFFGKSAGEAVTTGSKNTIIGSYTGNQGGLDIRTASNYIVLSDGDGNPNLRIQHNVGTWMTQIASGAGNSTLKWTSTGSGAITFDTSSRLVKENIEDSPYGLAEIMQLQPRKYFRIDDQRDEIGFVADEVEDILPEFVPRAPKSLFTKNAEDTELVPSGVYYDKLTTVLVKAIQELNAQQAALKAEFDAYKEAHP